MLFPLVLKVGSVENVSVHPNADKLFVLDVVIGSEKRVIVSGLRDFYSESDLINKNVIVVCNLKPSKLRGVVSEGMILAAEDKNNVVKVLFTDEPHGSNVCPEGQEFDESLDVIDIEFFSSLNLRVVDGFACFESSPILINGNKVSIDIENLSRIC